MSKQPKVHILSPHFDDAAYGLTLTISKLVSQHVSLTIINCFTVTKWTALPVAEKDVKSVSLLRAMEDAEYNKLFNSAIELINLDLLDAPLRNGYIFKSAPFTPDEWEVVEELQAYLEENVDGLLLCPLGIGHHIDHAICRAATVRLYKKLKVIFYEDLPYAQRITEAQIADHIRELEEELGVRISNHLNSSKNAVIDKKQAVSVYKSQLNEDICSEILAHMNALKGERLWGEAEVISTLGKMLEN
jgi:LmbE family N-acetylglucosaminyl deacetylase